MAYFKVNGVDFSYCVKELKVSTVNKYNAQTNAAGNTVVDFINHKREIEVGIIPLEDADMKLILAAIEPFNVLISFRNPITGSIEENVNCIIPSNSVDYYTIQVGNTMYNELSLTFTEL
jgi:hypothetical protein